MREPQAQLVPARKIRRQTRFAVFLLLLLCCALVVSAGFISISGAVIASGQVSVSTDVRRIQHPTGGVVSAIAVKDGSRVRAGDILVSLDATATGANAQIITDALSELSARQARLEAERDSRDAPIFPPGLKSGDASARAAEADEQRLFAIRQRARQGSKAQLAAQKEQILQQIKGYEDILKSKADQIVLIDKELAGVRRLFAQDLVPLSRLNALERDAVQLRGDVGQLTASIAEARGKISEIDVQIIQVDQNARAESGTQLSDVQNQLSELRQKKVTAQQELKRVEIRAPQDGVVDRLAVHTVGGVIAPGETIMIIVPDKDRLTVEVHVRPTDIDKVTVGQDVVMRFSAFDQRVTPEVAGKVSRVSAESQTDEKTGVSFYTATVSITGDKLKGLGLKLVPGMPVETFIQTQRRTILSYLIKPLADQLSRAFKE